ncbi:hypothetical protein F2Q68_00023883 [Brassica cretica]|uniref:Rab-GAP TBC domain-containing protein n=1 Tax=Brassica cretica TaxID=69181 RepID=A0A8S9IEJ5_BRACR|nr:hypothetical protein F2Q68_00023883 [Brassica cretica]
MEGPTGVMDQLQSLWHILQLTDKDIFSHLSRIGAESLHFAFRMLLVLFRRELSFNEALRMWEMMWAADYDESVAEALGNDCLEPLVIQLPRKSEAEVNEEAINGESIKREPAISKSGPISKSSGLLSMSGLLPKSGPLPKTTGPLYEESGMKSSSSSYSAYHFCGLTRSLWSRNDRTTTHAPSVVSSIKRGDDALPVFCVAAILIMNRHKIIKETRSIDDMIQIFNDKVLVFRVRRCIRTAMKLRRKYMYKVIKTKSHTNQVQIEHQTHMESQKLDETQRHGENQSQTKSLHHSPAAQNATRKEQAKRLRSLALHKLSHKAKRLRPSVSVWPFIILGGHCFAISERKESGLRANFQMEGPTGVMDQLQSLWHILQLTDKDIFSHLSRIGAESLHFAFRMLLVLFRRELSFNEALRMWEMMWAADYDESVAEALENDCLEPLVIQLPRKTEAEVNEEAINGDSIKREPAISKSGPISKSSGLLSMSGLLPKSGPLPKTTGPLYEESGMKSSSSSSSSYSAYHFCGLTRSLWSRNDRTTTTHVPCVVSSIKRGDDSLPVFCVAAILIMNRHKIIKETRSIDDMIQIFNDKVLVFRVRRCIRTAMKLRRKYMYKVIKTKSHTNQVQIEHQTHMESQKLDETQSHGENQSQTKSLHHSPAAQNGD